MPHPLLHEAVARLWPRLPGLFGEVWTDVDVRLTTILRGLERDDADDAEDELFELFAASPAALAALNRTMADLLRDADRRRPRTEAQEPQRLVRYVLVPVLFGTDRRVDTSGTRPTFSGDRGAGLQFGRAHVSIPDDHQMGQVERPRWWRLEFREDPDRHVVIAELAALERDQFIAGALESRAAAVAREALVFVHGYNVTFDDALRRAAQIAYDLHFEGLAMLFSWPSRGSLQGYFADETNIRWAQNDFRDFLRLCLADLGLNSVHVLAHSMGNRVLAEVLASVALEENDSRAHLGQVIFAAPDIDTETFAQLARDFQGRARRFTMYASSNDAALQQSRLFHGNPRAGHSHGGVMVIPHGVDAIDASSVDTSLLGHAYYGDNRTLLADLFQLIRQQLGPDQRFGLVAKESPTGRYWAFRPGG